MVVCHYEFRTPERGCPAWAGPHVQNLSFPRLILFWAAFLVAATVLSRPGGALEAIPVPPELSAIDLTQIVNFQDDSEGRVQVETAPGPDGLVRRMEVRATAPERSQAWLVFALTNESDRQLDRLLVAPHHRLVGSGVFWPDLGRERIRTITPSQGFRPERLESTTDDVFLVTLDPGSTVTFVAEVTAPSVPRIVLWEPDAYEENLNSLTLFRGIVLGVSGLLALFLTTLFIVRGTAMFPAAAMLGWAIVAYLAVDFNLIDKVISVSPEDKQLYRASAEAIIATSLIVYLFAYLNLGRWHIRFVHISAVLVASTLTLLALAFADPPMASGISRVAIVLIGLSGMALIIYLAIRGSDRAVMLIPTWLLLLLWAYGAVLAVTGELDNDLVSAGIAGGLVLVVLLTGFTVMQHAFAGTALFHGHSTDNERKALALTGAGDMVWDWDVERDRIITSSETERLLGLSRGTLEGPAVKWLDHLHPSDRDGFRACLDTMVDQKKGRIAQDFRLRSRDGHYRYLNLRARPITNSDGDVMRCIGTLVDVTDMKTAQERLLHDAIHDNLTGLPNRDLFLDRLETALTRVRAEGGARPAILVLDVDRFRNVNESVGIAVGDSILLTVARRLARHLKPQDTLARLSGDQFAIILLSESTPKRIAAVADNVRRAFKSPITFGEREIFLTAAIGISVFDGKQSRAVDVLRDAELAMQYAKKLGGDRIEAFKPSMRQAGSDRLSLESGLRRAIERNEIKVFYQPIMRLDTGQIAGFEALLRWDHPRHGLLPPGDFISIAEETDMILDLGLFALERSARQLAEWQRIDPYFEFLFTSVNVSNRQIVRHDLINDIKAVLSRSDVSPGTLKLEVTESLVMDNPEYTAQVLTKVRDLGAGLALDDFGSGYSALSHLQRFPFDIIKVDKSFLQPNGSSARPLILRSIVSLAHDLGMEVVAEGAETTADAQELLTLGCEYAQGYYFGEPMTAVEARKLLNVPRSRARH